MKITKAKRIKNSWWIKWQEVLAYGLMNLNIIRSYRWDYWDPYVIKWSRYGLTTKEALNIAKHAKD